MAKKIKIIVTDKKNKEVVTFYSKNLTKAVNKLDKGTPLKVYFQENNYGKQIVGDYVTKSPSNEPEEPEEPVQCPAGTHWDETKQACIADVITPPPSHECPAGQHWDDAQQKCVVDAEIPVPTGMLWSSIEHGKWNDGKKRTITVKQGGQKVDDKSIFVAASGSPKLVIDGDGIAHLVSGNGGVDNLSLKLVSSHQGSADTLGTSGPTEGSKRGGGEGFAISHNDWDAKREKYHNEHQSISSGKLPKPLADNKWYRAKFTVMHDGTDSIKLGGFIDYQDGAGYKQLMNASDGNAESWFFDKTLNNYFWIRLNNSDHGRIYVMAKHWDASLEMDFMFEPANNSIALRNVRLVSI